MGFAILSRAETSEVSQTSEVWASTCHFDELTLTQAFRGKRCLALTPTLSRKRERASAPSFRRAPLSSRHFDERSEEKS